MKYDKRVEIIFLIMLVVLNILFRFPVTPHEKGTDSFLIHGLANSITDNGYVKWNLNFLSIFGFFPLSNNNGTPLLLSEFSLLSGIEMEKIIIISSMSVGVLTALSAYILARKIFPNNLFVFFVAFNASLSLIFLSLSSWSTSARTWFIAILPIFIWTLLKYIEIRDKKYFILSSFLFIILAAIHRMFVLNFLIIIALIISVLLEKHRNKINSKKRIWAFIAMIFVISCTIGLFVLGSFRVTTYKLESVNDLLPLGSLNNFTVIQILNNLVFSLGLFAIFLPIGLIYLYTKKEKEFIHIFLIVCTIIFALLITEIQYSFQYSLILLSILVGYGIIYINKYISRIRNLSKIFIISLIVLNLSILTVILAYQSPEHSKAGQESWARGDMYSTAIFLKNLDTREKSITTNVLAKEPALLYAYSKKNIAVPQESMYLIQKDIHSIEVEIDFKDIKSYLYDFRNPFTLIKPDIFRDRMDVLYYSKDNPRTKDILQEYNIGYMVESKLYSGKYAAPGVYGSSAYLLSIHKYNTKMYDNNLMIIWDVE